MLSSSRYGWARALEQELKGIVGDLGGWEVLVLAATSSLAEEAAFRAVLQEQAGLPVAALTFGLLHTIPRRVFLPWTAFALAMGVALGALYEVHGGALVAPVTAHFLINLVNLRRIGRCRSEATGAGTLSAGPHRV
ncbi:MAG: CPBP family intramembrane metalloprotease [Planctomycetes bacterium]|nr:CPBP family intramembrane metalloprotease [Planctomycetota bacterium]